MSIFSTILEKLGISKPTSASLSAAKPASGVSSAAGAKAARMDKGEAPATAAPAPAQAAAAKPAAVEMVDVMSKLESMAGPKSGLDWKVSIVDLLKLLGMDSSLTARKELAAELHCPADLMSDSAKMNTWLHKTVLQKIAENGGNIPEDLLR